jgi:hypothetical protein
LSRLLRAAKQAIIDFAGSATDRSSPSYVPREERLAVFDQDETLWAEPPMFTQVAYCLERVPAVVAKKPELKNVDPFKTARAVGARMTAMTLPTGYDPGAADRNTVEPNRLHSSASGSGP